jgi:hypothetical protein
MLSLESIESALVICNTNISYYFAELDNVRPKRPMEPAHPVLIFVSVVFLTLLSPF